MRKTLVIAVREYKSAVKTKAFLITLVAMPILFGGSIVVHALLEDKVDTRDRRVAVLDRTDQLFQTLDNAAQKHNQTEIFDQEGAQGKKVKPCFVVQEARVASQDLAQMRLELSEQVRNDEIMSFVIIGRDVIDPGEDQSENTIAYHSNTPTYDELRRWIGYVLNERIRELRLEAADLDSDVVQKAIQSAPVGNLGLVEMDETGQITRAEEANRFATIIVPFVLIMLMFMVVMVGAQPLLQSVLEEKMQRIAEVLLGSIPPFQLMMGKLLGTVGMSLTLLAVYLVGGFLAVQKAGVVQFFPTEIIWWFVLFQALAVLLFGSLFIAIGAACTDLKESQSMLTPVMVLVISPLFVWMYVLQQPNAPLSVALSLFPPATPMLMIIRQAVPPGIPLWQPLLGVLLLLITTVLGVLAASRIFRVGILMQGKGAKFGEMLRWIFRG
ncbi:MAG: ABC transporter permease [Phycisphaerales bacterium]|nr:MAG: ABC transporter permease [Phycisphaerales bacterium]